MTTRTLPARLAAILTARGKVLAAAGLLLAMAVGLPAVMALAQGRAAEHLPAAAADALAARVGGPLVFAIAVGDNGRLEPAPGPNVAVRREPAGFEPPRDKIIEEYNIRIVKYETNSHCYVYYVGGVQHIYCPQH
jgi:hypothetical protein